MKDIVAKSGGEAKLRLRGKGSGFVEKDTNSESSEPLQLCISCPTEGGYRIARESTEQLMKDVYSQYNVWAADQGKPDRAPEIRMTERHLVGDQGTDTPSKRQGRGRGGKKNKSNTAAAQVMADSPPADHGDPIDGAPEQEEIERLIKDRNDARRRGDFDKADSIRDDLKDRGVVLSDEKGGHGSGLMVTSWRYWRE